MPQPTLVSISTLRGNGWKGLPSQPGIYWWYFPEDCIKRFQIPEYCDRLNLRSSPDEKLFCLYVGIGSDLFERIGPWHSAQRLTLSNLKSGWLSTLRRTLLALTE